jgi:hypothetical protein
MRPARATLLATALLGAACGQSEPPSAPEPTSVVVGITSDFVPGADIGRLVADVHVGGSDRPSTTWTLSSPEPLAFPIELWISDLSDGERVDVLLSAFEGEGPSEVPFLTRAASTSCLGGAELLLRAHLEWECVPSFQLPGDEVLAPECKSPETCIAASCEDPYVPPSSLQPYYPSWAVDYADECRPEGAGDPQLTVGQGVDHFEPLEEGDLLVMHSGSQGGFHVWVALRARDLHREGSTTTVDIRRADTGEELCGAEIPWDFTPSEGGACDLWGIRCVVSFDIAGASQLHGKEAIVSAKAVDLLGNVAFAERTVVLGPPE